MFQSTGTSTIATKEVASVVVVIDRVSFFKNRLLFSANLFCELPLCINPAASDAD